MNNNDLVPSWGTFHGNKYVIHDSFVNGELTGYFIYGVKNDDVCIKYYPGFNMSRLEMLIDFFEEVAA